MQRRQVSLSDQVKQHARTKAEAKQEFEGDTTRMISTGSTLLDLAISGGRRHGGGLPGGIFVEIFGPPSCGKTVMLCEIAGNVQRKGGEVEFFDPEGRLNKQFAQLFGVDTSNISYTMPNTVPEVFGPVREIEPISPNVINAVLADSLAALSTDAEMEEKDAYGMRRAKEFSEELRKTCRILTEKNLLMVCSNQLRQNLDAGPYGIKYKSPGGEAIGFYASLRLRCMNPSKIKRIRKVAGKEVTRIIGVETEIEVFKSSVWKPFHTAPLTILFDYGIDDIRQNVQFIKDFTKNTTYTVNGESLGRSIDEAISQIEADGLQKKLRQEVIGLWEEIEAKFAEGRVPKFSPRKETQ